MAVVSFFQATSDPADGSSATTDLSGNGNSGTVYGGSWVDASYGASSGRALRFAGGKSGIEWASKIAQSSGPFTVRLWVKCDSDSSAGDKFLYARANAAKTTVDDYVFYFNDGDELLFLPVGGGGSNLQYSVDLRDDTWHQIVYSTDGTNQYLFLDDSQVATNALFSTLSDDATCDVFGSPVDDVIGRGWDGDVSLIAVSDTVTDLATVQADYALGPFHNPFETDLSTGLQGWWCPSRDTAGNGTTTLTDLSGNGNNGTLTNMDAATDWVADTDNGGVRALDFDGINDYVALPEQTFAGDFAISLWVKPSQLGINEYFVGHSGSVIHGLVIRDGGFRFWIANSQLTFTASTSSGEWHHVAVVRSDGDVNLYWDGVASVSNPIAGSGTLLIDQIARFQASRWATCRVDGLAFWDRALTPAEVTQLYNGGRSLNLFATGTTQSIVPQLLLRRHRMSGGLVI